MNTKLSAPSSQNKVQMVEDRAVAGHCENARVRPPSEVSHELAAAADADSLIVVVDVDALGDIERHLWLVLDALSHARVQIVIASRSSAPASIARWQTLGLADSIGALRDDGRHRVIALSSDPRWVGEADGALAVERPIAMRAALWWIVKARSR